MTTIDNQQHKLFDKLEHALKDATRVDMQLNSATLWALYKLLPCLQVVKEVRVLLDKHPGDVPALSYDEADWRFYNQLSTKGAASELVLSLQGKVKAKVGNTAPGSFLFVHQANQIVSYILNGAPLNTITLGLSPDTKRAMILEMPESTDLQQVFEGLWPHAQDVTEPLLAQFRKSVIHYSPQQLYHQAVANIFKEGNLKRDQEDEIRRIKLDQTAIWKMLYSFQRDAVLGAIDKIEKHNGCIIADSVGLGKTFEALAIIKYYQLRNKDILVLSPKKLKENWSLYVENDHRNPFGDKANRFDYKVLSHSDLNRKTGMVGNINLETFNWGSIHLLVIDESHNFRNIPTRKNDENTRYQSLMNKVIKAGNVKVLMLSATPVNTRLTDLKAQLQIMFEQDDAALKRYNIRSISSLLGETQRKFNVWLKQNQDQIGAYAGAELTDVLPGAYFKLLDLVTIARSRKHIETYYNTGEIGKFPVRLAPISEQADIDTKGEVLANLSVVYETLGNLNLAMYQPLNYVLEHKAEEYNEQYRYKLAAGGSFYQSDRDQNLVYLMRVNFLKRLESSWYAFSMTLEAIMKQVENGLAQVENHNGNANQFLDNQINQPKDADDQVPVDVDDAELEELMVGSRTKVKINDMDRLKFQDDLKTDLSRLQRLKNQLANFTPERDAKLLRLKQLIEDKIKNPINGNNKKVLIFSAYANTVDYLYDHLAPWLLDTFKLYTASVNGARNRTNFEHVKNSTYLHEILTHFSPISKKRAITDANITDEITVLIATDCISEGQNLQDCDYQINYDIHWNPVRIIQRFGRIDRLGSQNEKIQLVNFYPKMDLDSYIDLIERVKGRMMLSDVSSTGQDNVLAPLAQDSATAAEAKRQLEASYRTAALKRLQTEVPNMEDLGKISITDLTYNDFRADLNKLTDEEFKELEAMPKGLLAVVRATRTQPAGVLFCLKEEGPEREEGPHSGIWPYHLIYMDQEGRVHVPPNNPKKALDDFRSLAQRHDDIEVALEQALAKKTDQYRKPTRYQQLLEAAMQELGEHKGKESVKSIFNEAGSNLGMPFHDTRFKLVNYLVVLPDA